MDAVEYVKTKYRLCRSKDSCFECPLQDKENCGCITDTIEYVEKAVQIVEEWAFDILEWENPHPVPECECEIAGCHEHATCGTPTKDGYKRVCGKHFMEIQEEA